eukprot:TRINITY_DN1034_c4_g2_i1.p1 TRINITY_DN1034_c4_g2~~TRINITY_DN1034_c4_g2_i1.p1  ORF type:complete len:861 (+),score=138.47 TRINITY_DN1034_c4_g2_i1:85-2667(+)
MSDEAGQMEFLVDAFRGLAFEGTDTGDHLANVESIVNSYFNVSQQQNQIVSEAAVNLSSTGRTVPQESFSESPIKPALNTSTESSESLRAWGQRPDTSAPSTPGITSMMKTDQNKLLASPILDVGTSSHNPQLLENMKSLQNDVEYEKDFYQRTVGWQRKHHDRIQEVAKAKEMLEDLECTWKPAINKSQHSFRSTGRVEDRLQRAQALKLQRLEQQRESASALERSSCTFQPRVNTLQNNTRSRYMDGVGTAKSIDDTFSRLYNSGRKIRVLNPNVTPSKNQSKKEENAMLYTTYTPDMIPDNHNYVEHRSRSRSRRRSSRNQSQQRRKTDVAPADPAEIEEMEDELREIERLLQKRTTKKHEILTVKSNYIDSDDETSYSEGSTATTASVADFNLFLIRQNAFEERRRANLAYLEADTAPSLRPHIDSRSKKLAKKEKNAPESKAHINSKGIPQKQQRLRWLLENCISLRKDLVLVQGEVENALRDLNIVNSTISGDERKAVYKDLKNEYNPLRLKNIEEGPPADTESNDPSTTPKTLPSSEYLASLVRSKDLSKLRFPKTDEALQSAIRDLIQTRSGISELRIRCIKIKDAIMVEKGISEDTHNGCIPWTTQAKMTHKNMPQAASNVKPMEKSGGAPINIAPGTAVLARREAWQGWEKGVLVSVDGTVALVELEGFKNPQKFPATTISIVPEKIDRPSFAPDTKSQLLRTCVTTKEVVKITLDNGKTVPGRVIGPAGPGMWSVFLGEKVDDKLVQKEEIVVKATAIKCSKDVSAHHTIQARLTETYVQELGEYRLRSEDKRQRFIADREFKQHSECTHAPHINSAPEYISRIATSMQLLRGESKKSSSIDTTSTSWR